MGTNQKISSEDRKANNKGSMKLSQDDFKTTFVSKMTPSEDKDGPKKDANKNKLVYIDDDQYEVVDTSYIDVRLVQK